MPLPSLVPVVLTRPFSLLDYAPHLWIDAQLSPRTLANTGFTGTGTVTQVGTALTGVGTAFTGEVKVGDALSGTGISGTVVSIASATALTLDASDTGAGVAFTITPTPGVSDRLSQVNDLSGYGRHLVQATRAKQSQLVYAGQNGLPTIRLDAIDDGMSATFASALPLTVYAVYSYRSATSANRRAVQGVAPDNWLLGPYGNTYQGYNGAFLTNPLAVTQNLMVMHTMTQETGDAKHYLNAALRGTSASNGVPGTGISIGCGGVDEPLDGDISAVAAYPNAHTAGQIAQMYAYYRGRGYLA